MKAKGYRIAESLRLDEVPADRVTSEWRAGGDCFWIDFEASCSEAMEQHGGDIEVDPILMQMCEEDATEIARVIPTDDAIFLPLTLLAGIYGMNFEFMPELHFPYAYPVMLGVMLAIAVGLWRYFKRKGWFD